MSQFFNTKDAIVTNALEGVLKASGGKIAQLDGFPHIKVLVRTDWDKTKVALVSGGGSGHEPAHAGFVGEGLLTAAVCGDIFASPSVDAVLAGILAVTGDAGCLLIVTNYTGDRLNFGFAAERARTLGLKVSMVVVDDDIALPELAQARGVAGTLLVHKIAGALAEKGADLDAVTATAQRVIEGAATIGMSLDTCTIPGSPKEQRIDSGKAELGLGIHGEPGVEQVEFTSARGAISMVVDKLAHVMSDAPHVALLNNLGGTTPVEMSILANELANSSIAGRLKWIIGPAALMTSLDMRGFSLTILPVDSVEDEQALQAPVGPSAWPGMNSIVAPIVLPLPDGLSTPRAKPSKNADRRALIYECCELMMSAEAKLNALDAKSGDGDTGSTVAVAARALLNSLDELPLADMTQLYRAIGTELSQKMGGSSGVLLAIFFTAAGDASASGHEVVASLTAGMDRIQQVGGASIGDRTMIDALAPALAALPDGLNAASVAARKGANHTSEIIHAKAGRASYVSPDMLAGNNDPGAEAVALLLEHLAK